MHGKSYGDARHSLRVACRQLQEPTDCARLGRLLEERSRLQYRLKLTLQELEHLRSNEKRFESESAGDTTVFPGCCWSCQWFVLVSRADSVVLADWLHSHSSLLERIMRHGRDGY